MGMRRPIGAGGLPRAGSGLVGVEEVYAPSHLRGDRGGAFPDWSARHLELLRVGLCKGLELAT